MEALEDHLNRIESMLLALLERQMVKDFYTTEEFSKLTGKAEFTVREWCRLGRVQAQKRRSGRGPFASWVISHREWERYQREGLLPLRQGQQLTPPSVN
jgi:hypothetical protein